MNIDGIIWLEHILDKLSAKHQVTPDEVEEALTNAVRFYKIERGNVVGEDLYYKQTREALIISARDATQRERQRYGRK
jgi:uncharacterized DUF497 family protein